MCVFGLRVGEALTPIDSHLDLVEDIQRRLKKQEKYRESCSAVAGLKTVRATIVTVPREGLDTNDISC